MLPTLTDEAMISDLLKRSYDQNLEVKITLKDISAPVIGMVVGGSRSVAGDIVDYISYDGFYSYTFKLTSGYEQLTEKNIESGNLTILASDIENIEVIE